MAEKVLRFKVATASDEQQGPASPDVSVEGAALQSERVERLAVHPDETMFVFEFNNIIDWSGFVAQLHMRWPDFMIAYIEREMSVEVADGSGSDQTFSAYKASMLQGSADITQPMTLGRVIFVVKKKVERDFKRIFTETLVSLGLDLVPEWTSYVTANVETDDFGINVTKGTMAPLAVREE